jgi:hypothetical protein
MFLIGESCGNGHSDAVFLSLFGACACFGRRGFIGPSSGLYNLLKQYMGAMPFAITYDII